jgi:transposase
MRLSPRTIYDTYLRGPVAVIRLFERTFGTNALCRAPTPDHQQQVIDSLGAQLDHLQAQLDCERAASSALRGENFRLRGRLAELEALITRDSHNSSRPPSTDHPALKRTQSLRRPSGRSRGGQLGHPGATLLRRTKPSRVVLHRPAQCRHCAGPLALGHLIRSERRQVIEIVPAKLRVTEHQAVVVRCMSCGFKTKGEFPQGVRASVQYGSSVKARALYLMNYQLLPYARTREALGELFGCWPSKRTLERIVAQCAGALVETELKIKRRLRRSAVIHADETGLRVGGVGHYVHVASTPRLTHYGYDAHRGRTAISELNILPGYRGTLVHDGWWAYSYYTDCKHALCGVHLLRELIYFSELDEQGKQWAAPIGELLLEMKREVEQVQEAGGERLAEERLVALRRSYDHLVGEGLKANPPPEAPDPIGKQARNLLLRLERRKEEVLCFMRDFAVPFDNNQAERDLRMVKLKQKTSGCLRTAEGARQFCRIRSYLSTMRKQGRGALKSLERACAGVPFHPTS